MKTEYYSIHPYSRLIFFVLGILGAVFSNSILFMCIFWLFGLVPFFFFHDKIRIYFKVVFFGFIPIYLSFIILYILVLRNGIEGFQFINLKTLKIIITTTIVQLLLSFKLNEQIDTLIKWRIRGDMLITMLGALSVLNDIVKRSDKIITARYARGFIPKRNIIYTLKQTPFALVPLLTGVMRTAIERSESWQRKDISNLLSRWKTKGLKINLITDVWLLFASLLFLLSAIIL